MVSREATRIIDERVTSVTPLRLMRGGKSAGGYATGFFYTHVGLHYLVTNRHVVLGQKANEPPDYLELRLHRRENPVLSQPVTIPLFMGRTPIWREWSTDVDVAVIPVDEQTLRPFHVWPFSSKDLLPPTRIVELAEDVFVMGYPLNFYDDVHNLPVLRNAMIASAFGVPFQGQPCFLTDANLHDGTSGSPVLTKPKSWYRDERGYSAQVFSSQAQIFLIGIHSGTRGVLPSDQDEAIPLGLGTAW